MSLLRSENWAIPGLDNSTEMGVLPFAVLCEQWVLSEISVHCSTTGMSTFDGCAFDRKILCVTF
jgi:hypothetical protein